MQVSAGGRQSRAVLVAANPSFASLYAKPFTMHDNGAHCELKFEREQGYFIGAMYINYAATIAIAVPGYFLLDAFTAMTINQQLALWVPFAVIFPLAFFAIQAVSGRCWITISIQRRALITCRQRSRPITDPVLFPSPNTLRNHEIECPVFRRHGLQDFTQIIYPARIGCYRMLRAKRCTREVPRSCDVL